MQFKDLKVGDAFICCNVTNFTPKTFVRIKINNNKEGNSLIVAGSQYCNGDIDSSYPYDTVVRVTLTASVKSTTFADLKVGDKFRPVDADPETVLVKVDSNTWSINYEGEIPNAFNQTTNTLAVVDGDREVEVVE